MLRCDFSLNCGELFTLYDNKLLVSRNRKNNHVREGHRKFDAWEVSSGLLEQSVAFDNDEGTAIENFQCNSNRVVSVTRMANTGYVFHGYEFAKAR